MDIIRELMHSDSFNDSDRRPKNWREMIMYLYPNGAPLTALMSMIGSESVNDPQFHWWTEILPDQAIAVTGTYTNSGLSTAYNPGTDAAKYGPSNGSGNDTLYFKCGVDNAKKARTGHTCLMRDTGYPELGPGVVVYIEEVVQSGASSYIKAKLLQDDISLTATPALGTFNHGYLEFVDASSAGVGTLIGSAHEENADTPTAVMYEPSKFTNITQIFRTPLAMSRTAKKTRLRTGDHVKQAKEEALRIHGIEMEKAFLFGVAKEWTGANGNPLRTTGGIINMSQTIGGAAVVDRAYFSGTWTGTAATGWTWLNTFLKNLFEYGSDQRIAFCGPDALLQLNYLVLDTGNLQITPRETSFGMRFMELNCPFGTIMLKQHPLFNSASGLTKAMLCIDPDNLKYRFIDDTQYLPDRQGNGVDGQLSEYLTEAGLELHHPETFRFADELGG